MRVRDVEFIWLDVPFHEIPQRNMERQQHGWRISEICRVTTDNGLVGVGETLPNYTWCKVPKNAVERVKGKNPFELMWDDSLGAGLQMALFDVAGKAAGVPVYQLLGRKVREWAPISWWGIDMSPQDYATEAKSAVAQGYTSFKQKARPWWDVYEQARLTCEAVPRNFRLDFDFNEHLISAANALPVLKELDKFENIAIYEEPIFRDDIEGNRRLRGQIRGAIAHHYQQNQAVVGLTQETVDGYVLCSGASATIRAAAYCEAARKPFWLQMVGTGLTTTFMAHLACVCSHARWPAITCMNMYVDQLVTEPVQVKGGYVRVPESPGLGIEFNEAALKYRVDSPEKPPIEAVYAIVRENGDRVWFGSEWRHRGFWNESWAGNLAPFFEHGVRLETWKNDGSQAWKDLAARCAIEPVRDASIATPHLPRSPKQ